MDQLSAAALRQGGLPRQLAAGHRHGIARSIPRRLLAARRRLPDLTAEVLGSALDVERAKKSLRRSSIPHHRSPRRNRSHAPSNCWRMPNAPVILGKGAA
jgi:hypothetical protein